MSEEMDAFLIEVKNTMEERNRERELVETKILTNITAGNDWIDNIIMPAFQRLPAYFDGANRRLQVRRSVGDNARVLDVEAMEGTKTRLRYSLVIDASSEGFLALKTIEVYGEHDEPVTVGTGEFEGSTDPVKVLRNFWENYLIYSRD